MVLNTVAVGILVPTDSKVVFCRERLNPFPIHRSAGNFWVGYETVPAGGLDRGGGRGRRSRLLSGWYGPWLVLLRLVFGEFR